MTDTTPQAVVETPAPDANATADANANPAPSTGAVDTSDKSAPPKKDGSQKRIDELTWHRRNLEREVEYLRSQVRNQAQPAPEPKQATTSAPKKLADFNYDEEAYQAYLEDVVAEKAAAKLRDSQTRDQNTKAAKERLAKFKELESKFKVDIDDYEDVAHYARIDDHVADLVMDMEEGPRIAYHLGKHPELASRLNSMDAKLAAVELGRIDARLAIEREQAKARPVSKAPPPPPKIDATEPAIEKDPTQMSDKEFAKWRKSFMNKR